MEKAVFIGINALGDTLCTTPVLRAFKKRNPETSLVYIVPNWPFCRVLDANPDIDLLIYSEQMYLHGPSVISTQWLHTLPLDIRETTLLFHFDIQQVCSRPESFQEHISVGFSRLLDIPIDSVRPAVRVTPEEQRSAGVFVRKPYFVFSMHSVSNLAREDGKGLAKEWPRERWLKLAEEIHSLGDFDIIAVGSERDPQVASPHLRNLYGLPIKITASLIQSAACLVTLENGIAHLGAALDAPMVEIYSDLLPLAWACPQESTCCEVFYRDPRLISGEEVMEAVKSVLVKKRVGLEGQR